MQDKRQTIARLVAISFVTFLCIGGCKATFTPVPTLDIPAASTATPIPPVVTPLASTPASTAMPTATPTTLTPANTPTPTSAPVDVSVSESSSKGGRVVLFFHDKALWRTSVKANHAEKLTGDVQLLWTERDPAGVGVWGIALRFPPRVSPDGQWLIANDLLGSWWVFDLQNQNTFQVACEVAPSWSPSSEQFACVQDGRLYVFDVYSQKASILLEKDGLNGTFVAWSPDGRYIASARVTCEPDASPCSGEVWISEPAQGSSWILGEFEPPLDASPGSLRWFPDSEAVYIQGCPNLILSLRDRSARATDVEPFSWSPGLRYGVGCRLKVWQADGTELYTLPCDDPCQCEAESWSPDGERLAYITRCVPEGASGWHGPEGARQWSGVSSLYVVEARTGLFLWEYEMPDFYLEIVRWSPDGEYLLLDKMESPGEASPIWRLPADDADALEIVVEEGALLDVLPQWGKSGD